MIKYNTVVWFYHNNTLLYCIYHFNNL